MADAQKWRWPIMMAAAALIVTGMTALTVNRSGPEPLPETARPLLKLSYAASLAELNDAVEIARFRIRQSPSDWTGCEGLTLALTRRGRLTGSYDDLAEAGTSLASAFALAKPGSGPHMTAASFAMAVHRLGPVEDMLAAVERYAVPPDRGVQAEIASVRGDIAFYSGDYALAKSRYAAAAKLGDGPGVAMRMANWSAHFGGDDEALDQIDRARRLSRHPSTQAVSEMLVQQATVQLGAGQWTEAGEALAEADRIFPGDWRIAVRRAKVMALQGDLKGAADRMTTIAAATGNPEVLDDAALLLRTIGKHTQAQPLIDQASRSWKKRLAQLPEASAGHALEHELHFGDPRRALYLAGANLKARPYGEAWLGLAEAWMANDRPDKALQALDRLEASGWRSFAQYLIRSTALEKLGRSEESPAVRAKALALNPHAFDANPAVRLFDH